MARLKFFSFAIKGNGMPATSGLTPYVACDPGAVFCGPASDTDLFPPTSGSNVYIGGSFNSAIFQASLGNPFLSNSRLDLGQPFSLGGARCLTVTKDSLGGINEIWCCFEIALSSPGNQFLNLSIPSTWMQSSNRWQVFKFGDLSLRLKALTGNPSIGYYDVTFAAYNGSTHLGDTTVLGIYLLAGNQIHVRVHAKLASGSGGIFELLIGGVSANYTGIDSTTTTAAADVDRVWFSGGGMQDPDSNNSYSGSISNILIDDAAWPTGRPVVAVITSGFTDNSLTNWAASGGGTMSNAVLSVDSNRARGTGNGARAILNIPAPTMTTWNANLLGYQLVPGLLSNLDNINLKRVKAGVRLGGVDRFGSQVQSITPPFSPTQLENCGTDTVFYNGGTTDFTKADVANTDAVFEVTS